MEDKWFWIKACIKNIEYLIQDSLRDIKKEIKELVRILKYKGNYTDKVNKDFDEIVKKMNNPSYTDTILKDRHED